MNTITKKKIVNSKKWVWTRRVVQTLFLLLFFYFMLVTVQGVSGTLPQALFFHLDPLVGITSMIAGRVWIAAMAIGVITLLVTLVIGRGWCGWICPLGTILDWTPSHRNSEEPAISPRWAQGKYFTLLAVLIAASLGSLTLIFLDPITLFFRTMSSAILPGLNWAISGSEAWLYNFTALRPAVEWVDGLLRPWLLNSQPFYLANLILLAVFAAVLFLNAVRSRFWCRYICPLGGLLSLLSKVAVVRHSVDAEKCISCRKCSILCPTGAIKPEGDFIANSAECTLCLHCLEGCPKAAISFRKTPVTLHQPDAERRSFLYSLGAVAMVALLLNFIPSLVRRSTRWIRPPGSTEESLEKGCVRCGECLKVCPTGVLQPLETDNPHKLWTPVLQTRLSYCDYSCNSCGLICPTGAIAKLILETKHKTVIGIAWIDQTRCIPWVEGRECHVCEEVCPVPQKAIRLGGGSGGGGRGSAGVRHPKVVPDLCIGCGICENQCPVAGISAIRIFPPSNIF